MDRVKAVKDGRDMKCDILCDEYPDFCHQITIWVNQEILDRRRIAKKQFKKPLGEWLAEEMLFLIERDVYCVIKRSTCGKMAIFGVIPDEEYKKNKTQYVEYFNQSGGWRDLSEEMARINERRQLEINKRVTKNLSLFNRTSHVVTTKEKKDVT